MRRSVGKVFYFPRWYSLSLRGSLSKQQPLTCLNASASLFNATTNLASLQTAKNPPYFYGVLSNDVCFKRGIPNRSFLSATAAATDVQATGSPHVEINNNRKQLDQEKPINFINSKEKCLDVGVQESSSTFRTDWGRQLESSDIFRSTAPYSLRLEFLIEAFNKTIFALPVFKENQVASSGVPVNATFCIITAFLASDNVIINLFNRLYQDNAERLKGVRLKILAVDTLHLFPETLQTAELMKYQYPEIMKFLHWEKPNGCQTKADFERIHGTFARISDADFDYLTKVEPLKRGLAACSVVDGAKHNEVDQKTIIINGRRNDQGNQRTSISLWEGDKSTLNPLINWTWDDVTLYCQHYNIPVNPLHNRIYLDIFNRTVAKKERSFYKNFLEATLDYPYFYYKDSVLRQIFNNKETNFYVWKSFGDQETSVPVEINASERDGRFVHRIASECGIHTRLSSTRKAPHGGGSLINLLGDSSKNSRSSTSSSSNSDKGGVKSNSATTIANNITITSAAGGPAADKLIYDPAIALTAGIDFNHIVELNERQVCDLELLMNGGYSPLSGFMNQSEYESCVEDMRLPEGALWGLPIVLDLKDVKKYQMGDRLLLTCANMGGSLAVMEIESIWKADKAREAMKIFGTTSIEHPYIDYMVNHMSAFYVGGPIVKGIQLPKRKWLPFPFRVASPTELRQRYKKIPEVLAFQCRNPLHRAHVEMFTRGSPSAAAAGASVANFNGEDKQLKIVVHPSIGPSKQDDFNAKIRVPTYEALQPTLQQHEIDTYFFPYHMRLAGPRETVQHLICRKNYGFTQMIIGRDHAGCKDRSGTDFYRPSESQELAEKYADELGIQPIAFQQMVYVPSLRIYMEKHEATKKLWETKNISGTQFRKMINEGSEVPSWYAFPEVVQLLQASFRFHATQDVELPTRISLLTGKSVVSIEIEGGQYFEAKSNDQKATDVTEAAAAAKSLPSLSLPSSSPCDSAVDDQTAKLIISVSSQFPSVPFFVVCAKSTRSPVLSPPSSSSSSSSESSKATTFRNKSSPSNIVSIKILKPSLNFDFEKNKNHYEGKLHSVLKEEFGTKQKQKNSQNETAAAAEVEVTEVRSVEELGLILKTRDSIGAQDN